MGLVDGCFWAGVFFGKWFSLRGGFYWRYGFVLTHRFDSEMVLIEWRFWLRRVCGLRNFCVSRNGCWSIDGFFERWFWLREIRLRELFERELFLGWEIIVFWGMIVGREIFSVRIWFVLRDSLGWEIDLVESFWVLACFWLRDGFGV